MGHHSVGAFVVSAHEVGHRRLDVTRRNGIDAYAIFGPARCERPRQVHHSGLGRSISQGSRVRDKTKNRGEIDNRASSLRQCRVRGHTAPHRAGQVHVHDLFEERHFGLIAPPGDPGGIDQAIETIVACEKLCHRVRVANIEAHGVRASGIDLLLGQTCRNHPPARSAQQHGGRRADTAGPSGHNRNTFHDCPPDGLVALGNLSRNCSQQTGGATPCDTRLSRHLLTAIHHVVIFLLKTTASIQKPAATPRQIR